MKASYKIALLGALAVAGNAKAFEVMSDEMIETGMPNFSSPYFVPTTNRASVSKSVGLRSPFTIELPKNSGTGYRWVLVDRQGPAAGAIDFVEMQSAKPSRLTLKPDSQLVTFSKQKNMPGSQVVEAWKFVPKGTGPAKLIFHLVGPGQPDTAAPVAIREVDVNVVGAYPFSR